jgi:hypothetical protein
MMSRFRSTLSSFGGASGSSGGDSLQTLLDALGSQSSASGASTGDAAQQAIDRLLDKLNSAYAQGSRSGALSLQA